VGETASCLYLHPGDWVASPDPLRISTVLGPCVAVCLWDPISGVGGMNHVVLPHRLGTSSGPAKLAGPGTRLLVERVLSLGAGREHLRAQLIGGACLHEESFGNVRHIGAQNVAAAQDVLRDHGIVVCRTDVGGTRGRKVVFYTGTGATEVTLL